MHQHIDATKLLHEHNNKLQKSKPGSTWTERIEGRSGGEESRNRRGDLRRLEEPFCFLVD